MKSSRPPSTAVYRENGQEYRPDRCEQVTRAMKAGAVALQGWAHGHYPGQKLPPRILPGLNTVGFWSSEHHYDWTVDLHCNEGIELTFVENGQVTFEVNGCDHALYPDDVAVTRPWLAHRLGKPYVGPTRVHWFVLDVGVRRPGQAWRWPDWIVLTPADRKLLEQLVPHVKKPYWRADPRFRQCFLRIAEVVAHKDMESSVSLMSVLINEALVLLLQHLCEDSEARVAPPTVAQESVVQFWQEMLEQEDRRLVREWTLSSMARQCGLGVTQFVHLTRRLTNLPPLHYLQQCRLEYAARLLLRQPEQRIIDVAHLCGFNTAQYFARCFRRRFGSAPQVFRSARFLATSRFTEPTRSGGG